MRVLVVTRQFPNALDPHFAPFNRQQFAALGKRCEVEVLGSIPWFPGARMLSRWSDAGRLSAVPRAEHIDGLSVVHPRYFYVPRVGYVARGALYAASLAPEVLRRRGCHDVVLGSWAYPDGVGAVALARMLGVPAVIKVHGSDINVAARRAGVARNLRWALPRARRVVAVSRPLAEAVAALGVRPSRIDVVPNGVDGELFRPRDRSTARAELGEPGDRRRWLLFVGRLEAPKGVLELLEAFTALAARRTDVRLAVVGSGSAHGSFVEAARTLGDRLLVAGPRPLAEVPRWMAACDALVLPSWAEGTPNVILEALACGRRVVATSVGGIPDLLQDPETGEMVSPRRPDLLAAAMERALDRGYDAERVSRAGARGSWEDSARRLEESLRAAIA
jgi:glycosyltransferase involved in cell wall biosynthesis